MMPAQPRTRDEDSLCSMKGPGMLIRSGSWATRISVILSMLLLGLLSGAIAAAQEVPDLAEFEHRAVFNVSNPPDAPYEAHQSILLFVPGAEAPLHSHGGPGYISILEGELTLYEDGVENVYSAGDSLVETPDKVYKGGNYTDEDMVLMVTYLVPEGEDVTTMVDDPDAPEPPEIGPEPLASTIHAFDDSPASFDLIHSTIVYQPGVPTEPLNARGDTLLTTIGSDLDVSINGSSTTVAAGDAILIEGNQGYTVQNTGERTAITMSTELMPDFHSVAPAAGATVDRTFAMWLVVMTASALFVMGAILRLTSIRAR